MEDNFVMVEEGNYAEVILKLVGIANFLEGNLNLENGLNEVINPSSSFTNNENISGVATTITLEGTRSFAVDIQALVNKSFYQNPKRTTTGISLNRVHQILAVIEKHIKIQLSLFDCYLATAGGFELNDPSSDLAIAIAIVSSLNNQIPLYMSGSSFDFRFQILIMQQPLAKKTYKIE